MKLDCTDCGAVWEVDDAYPEKITVELISGDPGDPDDLDAVCNFCMGLVFEVIRCSIEVADPPFDASVVLSDHSTHSCPQDGSPECEGP